MQHVKRLRFVRGYELRVWTRREYGKGGACRRIWGFRFGFWDFRFFGIKKINPHKSGENPHFWILGTFGLFLK